jgi:uncharacterized membrane protein
MLATIKLFLSIMVTFFIIDMTWLGFIAKNIYFTAIGSLLKRSGLELTPNWFGALMVYIFLALGVLLFVLPKAQGHYVTAILSGALLGAIVYGVYDFTNYSILANWPLSITLIDLAWGTILCGAVSGIAVWIQKLIS